MTYYYYVIDPRMESHEKNLNFLGKRKNRIGIKMTLNRYKDFFSQNLNEDQKESSIKKAMDCELPPEDSLLGIVRANIDTVGAMAVLSLRQEGNGDKISPYWIQEIDRKVKEKISPWKPKSYLDETEYNPVDSISMAVKDYTIPIQKRVFMMKDFLCYMKCPKGFREKAIKEKMEIRKAYESGEIFVRSDDSFGFPIALVRSYHSKAVSIGYCFAPVLVIENPGEYSEWSQDKNRKVTVCQWEEYFDFEALTKYLNDRQLQHNHGNDYERAKKIDHEKIWPGTTWGGNKVIVCSPRERGTSLPISDIFFHLEGQFLDLNRKTRSEKIAPRDDIFGPSGVIETFKKFKKGG